nr:HD domain-containing protein [Prevotella sp. CAG:732]
MKQQVSLEIMEFVERQILPRYNAFGESHGLRHVTRVIKNSLRLADVTGADIDMVYVIAAYHDLGMEGPRAIHHLTSGKILMADARLKRWFNADQLKVMKEAVEDHRASSSRQPRSIYGKIVAEADRDIDVHEIFLRAIQYGKENDPDKTVEEHWERFAQHMDEKYSNNGYIKLWIPNSPNEKALKELRNIIEDKKLLRKAFDDIWKEMSEINP